MLRVATHADILRLIEIRGSVRENCLTDTSNVTLAAYSWFIDHAAIHVWEKDERIQGFSAGDPRDGSIWALFVHPAFESRGVGQILIQAACKSLLEAGFQNATLSTEPGLRAQHFYERNGWISKGQTAAGEVKFEKLLSFMLHL
jgi:ribosomal protein S18 acetylase RimI-like enzyme